MESGERSNHIQIYFEIELADSLEMRQKSKRGINDGSKITTFTSAWVAVAGKMELLVT